MYLHLSVCQSGRPTKTLHIKGNYFNEQKLTGLVCFFNLCVGFFLMFLLVFSVFFSGTKNNRRDWTYRRNTWDKEFIFSDNHWYRHQVYGAKTVLVLREICISPWYRWYRNIPSLSVSLSPLGQLVSRFDKDQAIYQYAIKLI